VLLLTVKGTPFIYYGEEIGMKDGRITRKQIQDPVGIKYWPFNKGRDPERTPMLWSGEKNAGFTTGTPWLPMNHGWQETHASAQEKDPGSLFSLYKALIDLRKKKRALMFGEWIPHNKGEKNYLLYSRKWEKEQILVLLNFSNKEKSISLPSPVSSGNATGEWKVLLTTGKQNNIPVKGEFLMGPYEAVIMEQK
jgi:alpha-glucosidase